MSPIIKVGHGKNVKTWAKIASSNCRARWPFHRSGFTTPTLRCTVALSAAAGRLVALHSMRIRHSPNQASLLLAILIGSGCATHHDAEQASRIRRGDLLLSVTESRPGSTYEVGVYVIAKGDNVYKICKKFQVLLQDFMAINPGLDPPRLLVGQKVRVYERMRQ